MPEDLSLARMIDANLNRAREGLRVVEDILRFVFEESDLCRQARQLRHQLSLDNDISVRQSTTDLGAEFQPKFHQDNIYGLIRANLRRAQEATRVLEESKKLNDLTLDFQKIRFELYELEKNIILRINQDA